VNVSGHVDKHYNFWNRDPLIVSARYLESNGTEDLRLTARVNFHQNCGFSQSFTQGFS
jgi:hypothetical protein